MYLDYIDKLEEKKLFGKGGAAFPTALKWRGVKEAEGDFKYILYEWNRWHSGDKE